MSKLFELIVDANDDGYPDDVRARFVLDLPDGIGDRAFWAQLLDLVARIGLETHALPMPLVVTEPLDVRDTEIRQIRIQRTEDIAELLDEPEAESWDAGPVGSPHSDCLTRFFTIDGALEDRDGDLLPDATRICFDLPDSLPVALGASLANLAARIGLESGGVTFPLVDDDDNSSRATFTVRVTSGTASLRATDDGWLAEGDAEDLARLLDRFARDWPHIDAPETGGVATAISALRHWMAGQGPEAPVPGEVIWQREWSNEWEVNRLLNAFSAEVSRIAGALRDEEHLTVTAFVSEPPEPRRDLARQLQNALESVGINGADVTVLSAFKSGLSWLRDVVIPGMSGKPVSRVRISYRRYEPSDPDRALDMPIRWLQELFPGTELISQAIGIPLDAIEVVELDANVNATFIAEAFDGDGVSIGLWTCSPPAEVQPFIAALGEEEGSVLVTSGGFTIEADGRAVVTHHSPTDLQTFWGFWQSDVVPALFHEIDRQGARADLQPFFGELVAEVWISEPNEMLGIREENDSAAEALAEDIYFTTLDAIALYGQRTTGEALSAPGQVIPIVHVVPNEAPRVRVTLRKAPERRDLPIPELRVDEIRANGDGLSVNITVEVARAKDAALARLQELATLPLTEGASIPASVTLGDETLHMALPLPTVLAPEPFRSTAHTSSTAQRPPMDRNIHGDAVLNYARSLSAHPEVTSWIEDYSYQRRPLIAMSLAAPTPGRLHSPTKAAIFKPTHLIVARHHANEISSTNAAFQLAWLCANDAEWRRYLDSVNVLLIPYENPDGAALHARLSAMLESPKWKHHPARYNALGFEFGESQFDPDTQFGESRVRRSVWHRWPADVVVDNHGVPSHEWVQPFAGFGSPPRFRVSYWIPQALLYGII